MFEFKSYSFDAATAIARFNYRGVDSVDFTETVNFAKTDNIINKSLLDRALFLSFMLIGTSYYKAHPTPEINLKHHHLDPFQADFFTTVYQEGLSQFAFENRLTRQNLAIFKPNSPDESNPVPLNPADYEGILSLQSGGKDSLLAASILPLYHTSSKKSIPYSFWYLGSSENHPEILDHLDAPLQTATRKLDLENLTKTGGLNGHVPITYIVASLALAQAILNHQTTVLLSIGHEGNEPHSYIDDLPVNHQWSKTWGAEKLLADYVHRYISKDLNVGSLLRGFSELKIAELFAKHCWQKYGHAFSSCNVANYRQNAANETLRWCGKCAKCANSYLLFAPFIERKELDSLFENHSLFEEPSLADDFKGLLGIENYQKPFECVGEIAELRKAYELKRPKYSDLPFDVPQATDFDYNALYETQPFVKTYGILE